MSKHARDRRPYIKPVTKLELSEKNIRLRWIAIVVLLAIAAAAIGYGFSLALQTEPGWQEVTVLSDEVNCSGDYRLMYDFGAGDVNPTAQYKKLEVTYKDLTVSAYRLFSSEAEGKDNLYHINNHLNEAVTVDPALYAALAKLAGSDTRYAYMAPVASLYSPVFLAANDGEAALYDPMRDPDMGDIAREMASYCKDPAMIRLEILEENQVRLNVAEEYLAFGEEYGIETYLDFGWMKNAFIIDYMADALQAQGFVFGYLSSYDGYTRNLDIREESYSLNIFHRVENDVYMPAVLNYSGPMSLVSLRNYPASEKDQWSYYAYGDGQVTSLFLDPADGRCRTSIDAMTLYSGELGCADIAMKAAPLFLAEVFDHEPLEKLAEQGIHSIRCHDKGVVCTEETVSLTLADPGYTVVFSTVK